MCVKGSISHLQIDNQFLGVFTRKDRYYHDVNIEKSSQVRWLNKQEEVLQSNTLKRYFLKATSKLNSFKLVKLAG